MSLQFRRAFILEIDGENLEGFKLDASQGQELLRMQFSIERDKLPWPNNASVKITNLSNVTRANLTAAKEVTCRLSVGYADQIDELFFGILDIVQHIKQGPDWITELSASDGGREIKKSKVSKSFKKGTVFRDVIKEILTVLKLGTGNLKDFENDPLLLRPLPYGGALHGSAIEELTFFLRSAGLEFSIQDRKIQFQKIGEGLPNIEGPLISPSTGMIGSPRLVRERETDLTRKKPKKDDASTALGEKDDLITTVEGEALLLARLRPGVPFEIQSESINGQFVAVATTHTGDTHGLSDWTVSFKGTPLTEGT